MSQLAGEAPAATSTLHEVASTADGRPTGQGRSDYRRPSRALRRAVNYELPVLVQNIEDNPDNITRFAIIATSTADATGKDKTALMFEIAHEPGALADTMAIFKRNRLNMTWIESFPIPGSRGRYLFFVEFVGHQGEPRAGPSDCDDREKVAPARSAGLLCADEPVG